MYAAWLYRSRFIRRHLLMLMMAFGWLLLQSQVAMASHDCPLPVPAGSMAVQHMTHIMVDDVSQPQTTVMKTPLCAKHCVPDSAQKETGHSPVLVLPVTISLAVVNPVGTRLIPASREFTLPASGPPATLRFCRFRE